MIKQLKNFPGKDSACFYVKLFCSLCLDDLTNKEHYFTTTDKSYLLKTKVLHACTYGTLMTLEMLTYNQRFAINAVQH